MSKWRDQLRYLFSLPNYAMRFIETQKSNPSLTDGSSCIFKDELPNRSSTSSSSSVNNTKSSTTSQSASKEIHKSNVGARATDSARLMKFTKELSGPNVILGM